MHLRRHIPPSCPDSQAAEACFGSPEWPAGRPVPPLSIEFDVGDATAVGPAAQELEQAGYELLPPAGEEPWGSDGRQAAIAGGRNRRHLVHPRVPRRELTACSRCADHRQALCIGRMHRIAWTTRSLSSGAWTLRGRRRLSGVRTTPSVALSSPTARHLACACRRGEPRAKRCFAGISVCGRPRSCCPFAARDCACCA